MHSQFTKGDPTKELCASITLSLLFYIGVLHIHIFLEAKMLHYNNKTGYTTFIEYGETHIMFPLFYPFYLNLISKRNARNDNFIKFPTEMLKTLSDMDMAMYFHLFR